MAGEHVKAFRPDDPRFLEIIRLGDGISAAVTPKQALRNTTVMRCVSLISFSIGMLPLHLQRKSDKSKADDQPLFRILHRKPNPWQTAYEFRSLMQQRALTHGDAFALIIRTGPKIIALVPLDPVSVTVRQNSDWSLSYVVTTPKGQKTYGQREVCSAEGMAYAAIFSLRNTSVRTTPAPTRRRAWKRARPVMRCVSRSGITSSATRS